MANQFTDPVEFAMSREADDGFSNAMAWASQSAFFAPDSIIADGEVRSSVWSDGSSPIPM